MTARQAATRLAVAALTVLAAHYTGVAEAVHAAGGPTAAVAAGAALLAAVHPLVAAWEE